MLYQDDFMLEIVCVFPDVSDSATHYVVLVWNLQRETCTDWSWKAHGTTTI